MEVQSAEVQSVEVQSAEVQSVEVQSVEVQSAEVAMEVGSAAAEMLVWVSPKSPSFSGERGAAGVVAPGA